MISTNYYIILKDNIKSILDENVFFTLLKEASEKETYSDISFFHEKYEPRCTRIFSTGTQWLYATLPCSFKWTVFKCFAILNAQKHPLGHTADDIGMTRLLISSRTAGKMAHSVGLWCISAKRLSIVAMAARAGELCWSTCCTLFWEISYSMGTQRDWASIFRPILVNCS